MEDVRPLVRSISCWTLSRYSKWIVQVYNQCKVVSVLSLILLVYDSSQILSEESFGLEFWLWCQVLDKLTFCYIDMLSQLVLFVWNCSLKPLIRRLLSLQRDNRSLILYSKGCFSAFWIAINVYRKLRAPRLPPLKRYSNCILVFYRRSFLLVLRYLLHLNIIGRFHVGPGGPPSLSSSGHCQV